MDAKKAVYSLKVSLERHATTLFRDRHYSKLPAGLNSTSVLAQFLYTVQHCATISIHPFLIFILYIFSSEP